MAAYTTQDLLSRSLSGAAGGALGGGAAGAAIGAWNAPPEERRQGALAGARKGALGGAALGATAMSLPPLTARLLQMRIDPMELERQVALAAGYDANPAFDKAIKALSDLRDKLQAVAPTSAAGAFGAGAVGAASSAAGSEGARRAAGGLRQKMFPKKPGADAPPAENESRESTSPQKNATIGPVPLEDNPQDQRTRRVAELLKKMVPTSSAGGSAAPTPPRGTP